MTSRDMISRGVIFQTSFTPPIALEKPIREAAEPLHDLTDILTAVADVKTEHRRLLDLVVVPLVAFAVTLQHVELMPDLRRRKEIARIRIFGDEAKSLLLAHAADHDRRMRPREALGRA